MAGPNVLSIHCLEPYPGWEGFKPEIDAALKFLFESFENFNAVRMGFRYVNLFTEYDHGVQSIRDLNCSVTLAGEVLETDQNLNYRMRHSEDHISQVRIATPGFVSGAGAGLKDFNVLVDVDVYSSDDWSTNDIGTALDWVENSHTYEKEQYFKLFTDEMRDRLVEEK